METFFIIIGVAVLLFFVIFAIFGRRQGKKNIEKNELFLKRLKEQGIDPEKRIDFCDIELGLYIDSEKEKWCIREKHSSPIEIYSFNDLTGFSVLDNGEIILKSGEKEIEGPFNAEVGKVYCKRLEIIIELNNNANLEKRLLFISDDTQRKCTYYRICVENMQRILDGLAYIFYDSKQTNES